MSTAILGAGLTGCTLARLLAEDGEEVVVLEAADTPGGLCRSFTADGFTFDTGGSHIIFSRDEEVLDWVRNVLGMNREERRRETKCLFKGLYVKYPFENGLQDLPPEDRFACLDGFVRASVEAELADARGDVAPPAHFLEWIRRTFGDGIADRYMVPYNEKIWKYPLERMSAHWVDGRVPRPPLSDVIRSACGLSTEGYLHQAVFSYPSCGGIEALIRAIASPVLDRVRCGFRVTGVRHRDGFFRVSDGCTEMQADRVISTIPLPCLVDALDDVPEEVADAAGALVSNAVACVFIGLKRAVPSYSWVYLPSPDLGFPNRISFPSNYAHAMAPEGCGSILAECTYRTGDPVDSLDDGELAQTVIEQLAAAGVLRSDDVVYVGVSRNPWAYVVYDLDYCRSIRIVREHVEARGIDLVGRFAEFEYLNMDGCIRHAFDYVRGRRACA